jgi:hypothetical protein
VIPRPVLLSDCDGAIRHVVAVLPRSIVEGDRDLAAALVAATPGRLTLVTHAAAAAAAAALTRGRQAEILAVSDAAALGPWAQDALLAYDDPGGPRLAPTAPKGSRAPARVLFERLDAAGFAARTDEGLPARGGNLLAGGDRVLVGADEWRRWTGTADAPAAFFADEIDAIRAPLVVSGGSGLSPGPSRGFTGPDGTEWTENTAPGIVERGSLQPIAHVDLAVTLLGSGPDGRPRAVVGDLRLAAGLTGIAPPPGRAEGFDRIAAALHDQGFEVARCPLPLVPVDDAARRRRTWAFLPYPNALVERCGGALTVRLPVFGTLAGHDLAAADSAAVACFEAFGATVVPLPGLGPPALRGGGPRCALKVVERGPA